MIELQTMPLRFRVWDAKDKEMYSGCSMEEAVQIAKRAKQQNAIVSQDTGLVDKNGKHIFTGDVLKDSSGENIVVEYKSGDVIGRKVKSGAAFLLMREWFGACDEWVKGCPEVIGNIWQNPELLKVQNA